jgi:hypothetical protein
MAWGFGLDFPSAPYSVMVPLVVILPTLAQGCWVNQRLPSGPAVMTKGLPGECFDPKKIFYLIVDRKKDEYPFFFLPLFQPSQPLGSFRQRPVSVSTPAIWQRALIEGEKK